MALRTWASILDDNSLARSFNYGKKNYCGGHVFSAQAWTAAAGKAANPDATKQLAMPLRSSMSAVVQLTALLCVISTCNGESPFRLPGSPYPVPAGGPNPKYSAAAPMIAFGSALSATQRITLQTLQGLTAATRPQLFRVDDQQADVWLDDLVANFGVVADRTLATNFVGLIGRMKAQMQGYVLFDADADAGSVSAAISACAGLREAAWVAVDVSDQAAFTNASGGLPMKWDARGHTVMDVLQLPGVSFNHRLATLQDPAKADWLGDWSVFAQAPQWWDTSAQLTSATSKAILGGFQPPAAVLGWGTSEGNSVDVLGSHAAYIHAADFARNLASLAAFYVPTLSQQRSQAAPPSGGSRGRHTVAFLMTDGDNIQWLLNTFSQSGGPWFGNPDRGKVKLGWTVSPALSELAPSVMQSLYSSMAPGVDNFVAAPSGVGYTILSHYPSQDAVRAFANTTAQFMGKSDLNVVNIIDDSQCAPSCTEPLLAHEGIDAAIVYYGNDYVGGNGALQWSSNGKPVLTGRVAMWGDNDALLVARQLRALSKDAANPDAYSIVPVHVWSEYSARCLCVTCRSRACSGAIVTAHNVSDVVAAASLLGSAGFDVVTPEELVSRISSNVFHDCDSATKATGSYSESCGGGSDSCGVLRGVLCDKSQGGQHVNPFFDHTKCKGSVVANCNGRLVCEGQSCDACPGPAAGSFIDSCTGCDDACGQLTNCKCAGGVQTNAAFDYSGCPGLNVANCWGALVCTGDPCV